MAQLKDYTRADMLHDFGDACILFDEGGGLEGAPFNSIRDEGAIAHLWQLDIAESVDDGRFPVSALKWPAPDEAERAVLLACVEKYAGTNKATSQRP